jgi:5'-nucleotidase / UDP-sugar diphosphatase
MLLLLHTLQAAAAILQILHTNDLHASLKTAGHPEAGKRELGGWAQVAAVMNRLEEQALDEGIPTIRLDGGDFFEGTGYYFADGGRHVLRAFDAMKYDAAALGNHDWLCGVEALNMLHSEGWFRTPLLAANFVINPRQLRFLSKQLQDPQHDLLTLKRARDISVNVFGLTTDERFYDWAAEVDSDANDVRIEDPLRHGARMMRFISNLNKSLRGTVAWRSRPQLNIALTHLGHERDLSLGRGVHGIDAVIGGHSHKVLHKPLLANPGQSYATPVFQAGYNGKYVGVIRVRVDTSYLPGTPRKKPELVSYHLEPVFNDGPTDPVVLHHVKAAETAMKLEYGEAYLQENIGWAQVPLRTGEFGPTPFALFAAESIRRVVQKPTPANSKPTSQNQTKADLSADVGFDIGSFHGLVDQAPGFVTRETLMHMYPRKFEINHQHGATVFQGRMSGKVLAIAVRQAAQYGVFLSAPGMTYGKLTRRGDASPGLRVSKINGVLFRDWYSIPAPGIASIFGILPLPIPTEDFYVALPELLARGAMHITDFHSLVLGELKDTGISIWSAMERYLRHTDENGRVIERSIEDFGSNPTGGVPTNTGANHKRHHASQEIIGDYYDFLQDWTDTVRRCKDVKDLDLCT